MTTQQISEQVRQLILQGELDGAASALVQFFDQEWKPWQLTFQSPTFNHLLL